ncbi:unnamed protein product [Fraxinus pennsylvanica]|uniref:Uncharacterized protein n=1 Tax=Fraxinus pennsylvanica TaxID=56036 RepID=A0AAD1Z193_9LAMI|nr:unnamed protein product [Fraxinus pennsylvanica]
MGLQLLALAKLSLTATSHGSLTPVVTTLLLPFLLKVSLSLRPVQEFCTDIVQDLRLFFFQMGEITSNSDGNGARWERVLRLVCERITRRRHARILDDEEESLHFVSMLSL